MNLVIKNLHAMEDKFNMTSKGHRVYAVKMTMNNDNLSKTYQECVFIMRILLGLDAYRYINMK